MSMSIAKCVEEAIEKLSSKDYEVALVFICIAAAATSNEQYPHLKKDNEKYKSFIRENLDLILQCGMGISFQGAKHGKHFKISLTDSSIKKPEFPGYATLEEVFYHVIRCNLIHEARTGNTVKFVPGNTMTFGKNTLTLPEGFLVGFLLSVIGASTNSDELTDALRTLDYKGKRVDVNSLWGDKEKIMKMATGKL